MLCLFSVGFFAVHRIVTLILFNAIFTNRQLYDNIRLLHKTTYINIRVVTCG
jgi:hypothetical protein